MSLGELKVFKLEGNSKIEKTLTMKWVQEEELDNLYDFMVRNYNMLENKETFLLQPKEEMFEPFQRAGKILGLYDEESNIVAQRYLVLLDKYNPELMDDIKLSSSERKDIIYLKSILVDRAYTGNKLQYRTLEIVKDILAKRGYYKYMSTISPFNTFSLDNALKGGLQIRGLVKKYPNEENVDGVWRYINYLDIRSSNQMENENIEVDRLDIDTQTELMSKGYIGKQLTEDRERIVYDRLHWE